jgi:hypothetical protein
MMIIIIINVSETFRGRHSVSVLSVRPSQTFVRATLTF